MRVVLQVALASLIADGAVQRMVGQQKLHHCSSRKPSRLGIGPDLHRRSHLRAARGHWLGRFLNLHQAHPAVAGHLEALMVAKPGYLNAVFLGSLEDGEVVIDLVGLVVDEDLDLLGGEGLEDLPEKGKLG